MITIWSASKLLHYVAIKIPGMYRQPAKTVAPKFPTVQLNNVFLQTPNW